MKTVAVLITVFNRRERTLACLDACFRSFDALVKDEKYSFTVYLHDDNSADSLSDDVEEKFPQVRLIRTTEAMYQNRGRLKAWKEAAKDDPDFYLWLDYDLDLEQDAFETLLETSSFLGDSAILAGTVTSPDGTLMYGGRTKRGKLIRPDDKIPVPCDIFDGNLVLVPRKVYLKIGMVDPLFRQSYGDYDYAVKARKNKIQRVLSPGILATCPRVSAVPEWRNSANSLIERYRALESPKGRPLREQFIYDMRSRGPFIAVIDFIALNIQVLFPKRKIFVWQNFKNREPETTLF